MSAKTPQSRKSKGRIYQQEIVKFLTACGFKYLKSTSMGVYGTDVVDPIKELPWEYTECKRHEKSPSLEEIENIMETKRIKARSWCFFSRQNRRPSLVVMPLETLQRLLHNARVNSGVPSEAEVPRVPGPGSNGG